MKGETDKLEEARVVRRRIVRRATYYTLGFIGLAIAIAAIGSAAVAWLVSRSGLPFLETWLILTLVVLIVPLVGMVGGAIWKRIRRSRRDDGVGSVDE